MNDYRISLNDLIDLGVLPCIAIALISIALTAVIVRWIVSREEETVSSFKSGLDLTLIFMSVSAGAIFSAMSLTAALLSLLSGLIFNQPIHWY